MEENTGIFTWDSAMCVLMVISVYFMGWTYWSNGFQRRGIRMKTALLLFDVLLSTTIVIISTVIGDGSTQAVWAVLGVANLLRLFYLRDKEGKTRQKKETTRTTPPPPPVTTITNTNTK